MQNCRASQGILIHAAVFFARFLMNCLSAVPASCMNWRVKWHAAVIELFGSGRNGGNALQKRFGFFTADQHFIQFGRHQLVPVWQLDKEFKEVGTPEPDLGFTRGCPVDHCAFGNSHLMTDESCFPSW